MGSMIRVLEKILDWDEVMTEIQEKGIYHKKIPAPSSGLMDFVVEVWADGDMIKVSIAHYTVQNGDLMRDPEVVCILLPHAKELIPIYYRNDFVGVEEYLTPHRRRSVLSYLNNTWAKSLLFWGYVKKD